MRTNFAIFLVFFGVATLDALRGGDWLRIVFWVVIGFFFFVADRREAAREQPEDKAAAGR